jgi:hypothetical protein
MTQFYDFFRLELLSIIHSILLYFSHFTFNYTPIEHRLFPHVTRACHGAIFISIELVKSLIEKTTTKTGLSVIVNLMDKVYAEGRQVADGFKENLPIIFDEFLPKWNYRAISQL